MDTTIAGGGPDCTKTGGGLGGLPGRLTYNGPAAGPGTMTCGAGAGNAGSRAKTTGDGAPDGSRPAPASFFSNGNRTGAGTEDRDAGPSEDIVASNVSAATGDSAFSARGDDDTALRKAISVAGDMAPKCSGVADKTFAADTSAEGGNDLRVDVEHKSDSSEAIDEGPPCFRQSEPVVSGCERGALQTPQEP